MLTRLWEEYTDFVILLFVDVGPTSFLSTIFNFIRDMCTIAPTKKVRRSEVLARITKAGYTV